MKKTCEEEELYICRDFKKCIKPCLVHSEKHIKSEVCDGVCWFNDAVCIPVERKARKVKK